MGKTVGSILQIAAIAAFVVVAVGTGVGLAAGATFAQALSGAIGSTAFLFGSTSGLGASIVGAAATYGLSTVTQGLLAPNLPKPSQSDIAVKSAIPPRLGGYGRVGTYGAYQLFVTSSEGVAVDVWAFFDTMGIAIEGIVRVYLGDKQVGTGPGIVAGLDDGSYGDGAVEIDLRLGAATETAFAQVTTAVGSTVWDSSHRGDGIVSGMVTFQPSKAKDYQKIYPNGQPALRIVADTQRCYDWRDEAQSITDPSTWTFTENPWLHYAHYVVTREKTLPPQITPSMDSTAIAAEIAAWKTRIGVTWARYFAPTLASWTAAADEADSDVALKAGGTEPRYRCCLTHKLNDPHKDTKTRILATCDGWVAPREDGALVAWPGSFIEPDPADEIGPDEIVSYSFQEGVEDEQAVNSISISYVSDAHDFNAVETTPWEDADDIAFRGAVAADTFQPDVPSHGQARRLAKRKMAKVMAPRRGSVTTNSGGRKIRGKRYIPLRLVEAGAVFYIGAVEITALTVNLASGGVTFTWIAIDDTIDAWNPATEEGDPAPVGSAVAAEPLDTPTITAATAESADIGSTGDTVSGASATGVRIAITAGGPDRADLTWFVRWRVGTTGSWSESTSTDTDAGPSASLITGFVPLAPDVNVEVQYQIGDGRFSLWSAPSVVDTTAH